MNLIPQKYPYDYARASFRTSWTARLIGGPETLYALDVSRKTYGIYWNLWYGWLHVWKDIEKGIPDENTRVSQSRRGTIS